MKAISIAALLLAVSSPLFAAGLKDPARVAQEWAQTIEIAKTDLRSALQTNATQHPANSFRFQVNERYAPAPEEKDLYEFMRQRHRAPGGEENPIASRHRGNPLPFPFKDFKATRI